MKIILSIVIILSFIGCLEEPVSGSEDKPSSAKAESEMTTGFDLNGVEKSCKAMAKDMMCTMQMTESDFFSHQCKEEGHEPFQCGCHDWICSKKIEFKNKPDSGKVSK